MLRRDRLTAAAAALALALTTAAPSVLADPPDFAPANGWRAKHEHEHEHEREHEDEHHDAVYVGYAGNRWQHDYGIVEGRCDRDQVGTVVGAVIGGAVGSTVGSPDNKLVAVLVGSAIGAVLGHEIGRSMDAADRACFGHALELGRDGQWVRWRDDRAATAYALQPTGGFRRDGEPCRHFVLDSDHDGRRHRETGSACRAANGEWRLIGG